MSETIYVKHLQRVQRKTKRVLIEKKEKEKKLLEDKINESHKKVLYSFIKSGINVKPLPFIVASQEILLAIYLVERNKLDISYNLKTYINGMYSPSINAILLDKEFIEEKNSKKIEHTLTHEYAHDLFHRFFSAIKRNIEIKRDPSSNLFKLLPQSTKKENLLEEIKKYVNSLQNEKKTENEKRKHELDDYFDEMFADSVALYLNENVDGEERFISHSRISQGNILSQDNQFVNWLENKLYYAFYDRMFSHGLRHVVADLPFAYKAVLNAFEKRYKKQISN